MSKNNSVTKRPSLVQALPVREQRLVLRSGLLNQSYDVMIFKMFSPKNLEKIGVFCLKQS
jgi:hypothetical protein